MAMMARSISLLPLLCLLTIFLAVHITYGQDLDQFTYRDEGSEGSPNNVYPPEDWSQVRCGDREECLGWPDKFETSRGWRLEKNTCRWCPEEGPSCSSHHQSPINLERNRAIAGDLDENECIDVHWMSYHDSTCTFEGLVEQNAFSIERHALKVVQPIERVAEGSNDFRLACRNEQGRKFGRIDFSKGFSEWWHLSHLDFHVPSEHLQENKRYDGELQMYHFYSVTGEEAGVDNQMAAVTTFLEAYDDSPDYDFLNRIICQWREVEERTREQCGLPSVFTEYPGCFLYRRTFQGNNTSPASHTDPAGVRRNLRNGKTKPLKKPLSAYDVIMHNYKFGLNNNETHKPRRILMEKENFEPADPDFDWDAFIASQYEQEEARKGHRHLLDYHHVGPWFNYFPLIGVKTEYYYRYSGTQTVPPCYGSLDDARDTRKMRGSTNHWRIMKDPIRVSRRQINEMHRLLKDRIAPPDDPIRPCQPDTAAKPDPDDPRKISVARPVQRFSSSHFKVFCECEDWRSKWEEDKAWCELDKPDRFYNQPYNFKTNATF